MARLVAIMAINEQFFNLDSLSEVVMPKSHLNTLH